MHGQHYSARELFPQDAACINQATCPCAMITDYEAFLRVTEDGHIWWLLSDAIRLGVGYLPIRDDHQMLATELRAPSNRVQMNERTLIGAFGDSRLMIERPMTFERDGFRYVDAEGFISWLSQYITQTQSEIAFPAELESEIKVAIAKAAASQPPDNCKEFESLTLALDGWFDKELDALPKALSLRVEQEFFPMPWDELSSKQRQSLALQIDYQHDPATEQERHYWWNFFVRLKELRTQLQQWKSVATPTASDLLRKESRLKELQQEIRRMEMEQRQSGSNYYPGRKILNIVLPKEGGQGGRPKGVLREALEMAYCHFRDKGDVAILKAGNIRAFMKSFSLLAKDDVPLEDLGKRKIKDAICERIKDVQIPRAGNCSVTIHERVGGRKTLHGETYDQGVVSKILYDLRKKHPLPS